MNNTHSAPVQVHTNGTAADDRPTALKSIYAALPQRIRTAVATNTFAQLTPEEREQYYHTVCTALKIDPTTKSFEWIVLNGKLTFYALRSATDQLRRVNNISIVVKSAGLVENSYVVVVEAREPNGRSDEEVGAVWVGGLTGEAYSNAVMKAYTKAKRRATLSIVGLGWLDESEIESIQAQQRERPQQPAQQPAQQQTAQQVAEQHGIRTAAQVEAEQNTSGTYITREQANHIIEVAHRCGWSDEVARWALQRELGVRKTTAIRPAQYQRAVELFSSEENAERYTIDYEQSMQHYNNIGAHTDDEVDYDAHI